jgi:hypothetical protein
MKSHQVFALVLIGWYLVLPPVAATEKKWKDYAVDAPLSRWQIYKSFDSAAQCEQERDKLRTNNIRADNPVVQSSMFARCISTDDPRLAK